MALNTLSIQQNNANNIEVLNRRFDHIVALFNYYDMKRYDFFPASCKLLFKSNNKKNIRFIFTGNNSYLLDTWRWLNNDQKWVVNMVFSSIYAIALIYCVNLIDSYSVAYDSRYSIAHLFVYQSEYTLMNVTFHLISYSGSLWIHHHRNNRNTFSVLT